MDKKVFVCLFSFPVLCEKFPLQIIRELTTPPAQKNFYCPCVCVCSKGPYFFINLYRSTGYVTYTQTKQRHNRFLCNDGRGGSGDHFLFYKHTNK
jgi:hypothetical protein